MNLVYISLGLDPAGPYFLSMPNFVRLDRSDAAFVDIIHTDGTLGLNLGIKMNKNVKSVG